MTSRAPISFRHIVHGSNRPRSSNRSLQTFPPERYSDLVRRRGGVISVRGKLASLATENNKNRNGPQKKLTKLLLNVNIDRSLGPMQVILPPENKVMDLIKAVIEIYVKEKRRPFLSDTNPECFELHYSQFSLESLKGEEKLINLGSRNFFMCSKPPKSKSVDSYGSEKAKMAIKSTFPFLNWMDFLL